MSRFQRSMAHGMAFNLMSVAQSPVGRQPVTDSVRHRLSIFRNAGTAVSPDWIAGQTLPSKGHRGECRAPQ